MQCNFRILEILIRILDRCCCGGSGLKSLAHLTIDLNI